MTQLDRIYDHVGLLHVASLLVWIHERAPQRGKDIVAGGPTLSPMLLLSQCDYSIGSCT